MVHDIWHVGIDRSSWGVAKWNIPPWCQWCDYSNCNVKAKKLQSFFIFKSCKTLRINSLWCQIFRHISHLDFGGRLSKLDEDCPRQHPLNPHWVERSSALRAKCGAACVRAVSSLVTSMFRDSRIHRSFFFLTLSESCGKSKIPQSFGKNCFRCLSSYIKTWMADHTFLSMLRTFNGRQDRTRGQIHSFKRSDRMSFVATLKKRWVDPRFPGSQDFQLLWFGNATKMVGPIIDDHDAIFGLKGFKNFATSWAFRSFSCTYRCLDVLKVSLAGRWWHFHVMIFHDISWQSFAWSILHIFVNVCHFFWARLYISPQTSYVRFLPTMTERRIDPDDGVASLSSILVILSDTAADVVPFSLPCWGIPGKIFQRTILESCLAEHIQKTSWSIRCPWISLHDLNMVWRLDSTRHRGIRKRPSKHTGRSARSRKVDPTCWTIAWMIGDGLGDKNHMDSYGITMNRPHKKGRVRIFYSHNLHFFSMDYHHEVLF